MEEQQEPTKLIHGSKEKHNKAMHMHTTPNPNPSQTIMRLASLAISSNVRLKSSDMPSHMQEHALRHTRSLFPLHHPPSPKPSNTLIARALKKVQRNKTFGRKILILQLFFFFSSLTCIFLQKTILIEALSDVKCEYQNSNLG